MKKSIMILVFLLYVSSLSAQNAKIGCLILGNFGNRYLNTSQDYEMNLSISLKNNLLIRTSYIWMDTKRKYETNFYSIKYDFSQKAITETVIYMIKNLNYKPFIGLGVGYYKINYEEYGIGAQAENTLYWLENEKVKNTVGYHFCAGIYIDAVKNIQFEILIKYITRLARVNRIYLPGYYDHPGTPYDLYKTGTIKLDSFNIGIGIIFDF